MTSDSSLLFLGHPVHTFLHNASVLKQNASLTSTWKHVT